MASLGLDALMNVVIPGSILFIAVTLAINTLCPDIKVADRLNSITEWQAALLALVASTFFGALMQSFSGFVEERILDPICARRVRSKDFYGEWDRYIDSLEHDENPYVARIAHMFYFELRGGLAAILLGISLLIWGDTSWKQLGAPTVAVGVLLVLVGSYTHYWLALFRKRRFETPVSSPTRTVDSAADRSR